MTKKIIKPAPVEPYAHRFHCTPLWNLDPILKNGIDPTRATGAEERSWYVDEGLIKWAINHVLARHSAELYQILVLEVEQPSGLFASAPKSGLYYTYNRFRIIGLYPAENWLAREE